MNNDPTNPAISPVPSRPVQQAKPKPPSRTSQWVGAGVFVMAAYGVWSLLSPILSPIFFGVFCR